MKKLSRNDDCWCGSNKKYKKCHQGFDEKLSLFKSKGFKIPSRKLIKNDNDILGIKECAKVLSLILDELESLIKVGTVTRTIDQLVYDLCIKNDAYPATIGYQGYEHSSCISINNVICHGIPSEAVLSNGDIVNVDIAIKKNDYYADASRMYCVGNVTDEARKLVDVTKECLYRGIEAVKPYEPFSNIGLAIEPFANSHGYSVVRDFTGHGIGLEMHEDPQVYHFESNEKSMIMAPGMVFTIEPMINEKSYETDVLLDGWTVTTVDGGLSAQWEHTILVTEDGYEILT